MSEVSNERNTLPEDELTEEQLAQASGGVGDPHQPVVNPAPSNEEKKNKPAQQQEYMQVTFKDLLISS